MRDLFIIGVWMAPAKILTHQIQPGVEQVKSCPEDVGDRRMRAGPATRVHTGNCKVFDHVRQADAELSLGQVFVHFVHRQRAADGEQLHHAVHAASSSAPPNRSDLSSARNPRRAAFPDLQFDVHEVTANEDTVMVSWTMTGTHQAEWQGIPATGRQVAMTGVDVFKIADGMIVQERIHGDFR